MGLFDLVISIEPYVIVVYVVLFDIDLLCCTDDFECCLLADHVPSPYPSLVPYVWFSPVCTPFGVAVLLLEIFVV